MDLVIFDLDRTVLRYVGYAEKIMYLIENHKQKRYVGQSNEPLSKKSLRYKIRKHWVNNKRIILEDTFEYTIQRLKELQIPCALVTNAKEPMASLLINSFNLRDYFDVVTTRKTERCKPFLDLAGKLFVQLGYRPKKVCVVGDTRCDISFGRALKAMTIHYNPYGHKSLEADFEIQALEEVVDIVQKN